MTEPTQHASVPAQAGQSRKYFIPAGSGWASAWKVTAGIAAVGALIALAGAVQAPEHFAFSYLFAVTTVMTLMVGTFFFVLIQHLTGAYWSVTVRRSAEFFVSAVPAVIVMAAPLLILYASTLFPWWSMDKEGTAQAQAHEAGPAHDEAHHDEALGHPGEGGHAVAGHEGSEGHHSPEHLLHAATMHKKAAFLNHNFFYLRMVIYFAAWMLLSRRLFGLSVAQDVSKDKQNTVKLRHTAYWGTTVFAFSLTFAGFDWIMSLEPNWYSTMFGVRIFASGAVTSFASVLLVTYGLKKAGVVKNEINTEHFHDLGKLMFGFLVFWSYISFAEFMLIWYAGIPEETVYYHRRWDYSWWQAISVSIVVLKFILPFYFIMSRNIKRRPHLLRLGAIWILMMHPVEMYYWVMPYAHPFQNPDFSLLWIDAGCLMATVGVYLTLVFRNMLKHPVIPVGDPRLERSINFVNS